MKIIVASDSFKGSLTSFEVGRTVKNALPQHHVQVLSLSDGGEGSLDSISAMDDDAHSEGKLTPIKGKFHTYETENLFGESLRSALYLKEETAFIESACSVGLHFQKPSAETVQQATSYPVGLAMQEARKLGFTKLVIFLGGTGVSDGGLGLLQALGVHFFNEFGEISSKTNLLFQKITSFTGFERVKEEWAGIDITVSTDVSAVYTGKNGSVEVFSAQKGAVLNQRNLMEAEMLRIQKEFQRLTQKDLSTKSGTGAAGGLGGVLWLLGGHIHSGFDIFESLLKLENRFRRANLVITGEGKLDAQTSLGKLPIRVAKLCQKVKVPVVAICGSVIDEKRVLEKEFQGIYPIQTEGIELEEAMQPEFAKQKISEIVQKILKGCV